MNHQIQEHAAKRAMKHTGSGDHQPQPPPGQRRGYGMKGLIAMDNTPQTSRPTKGTSKHSNIQSNNNTQRQPLTARPPAHDKTNSGRPVSKRQMVRSSQSVSEGSGLRATASHARELGLWHSTTTGRETRDEGLLSRIHLAKQPLIRSVAGRVCRVKERRTTMVKVSCR